MSSFDILSLKLISERQFGVKKVVSDGDACPNKHIGDGVGYKCKLVDEDMVHMVVFFQSAKRFS